MTLDDHPQRPDLISRAEAKERGLTRYFTGVPCKNGHVSERLTNSGHCWRCLREAVKRWEQRNLPTLARWKREKRNADLDAFNAKRREYTKSERHRAWRRAYDRNRSDDQKAKAVAKIKEWQEANPNKMDVYRQRSNTMRRTRRSANGGSVTAAQLEWLMAKQQGRCAYCHKKSKLLELDHITPLALGGSSDLSNLAYACRSCNRKKGKKDPISWAQENGKLL